MSVMGIFFVLAGGFTICAAWLDWNWFMEHYKARIFVKLFGRNGARVMYAVIGIVLVVIGLIAAFGGLQLD